MDSPDYLVLNPVKVLNTHPYIFLRIEKFLGQCTKCMSTDIEYCKRIVQMRCFIQGSRYKNEVTKLNEKIPLVIDV